MRALSGLIVVFGLALAVSGQVQPASYIKPLDVPVPALEPGQKPNFIVIVTDDQGWDDMGRNNPKYVSTPNLDRFIQEGTFFDNYYVTPQCAQSRAAMLTGRYPARVGTMLVNGAWDFISSHEVTGAKLLGSQKYATAQFGKWHNSEVQGYEPWSPMVGFERANIPVSNDGTSNMRLMRTNGSYEKAEGDIERVLLSKMMRYLGKRDDSARPFYIYYAPHSIHLLYEKVNGKRQTNQIRFSPPQYKAKYYNDVRLQKLGVTNSTIDAWAALEYLDDVLGSLFDYLKATGLDKTTYVMVMSDNGSAMLRDERPSVAKRMPSGMKGDKSTLWEGGIRNFLAVQGPGVQAGVVDSTLLHIIDVLPTITDLAGARKGAAGHLPFDGLSFKNLLLAGSSGAAQPAARRQKKAGTEAAAAVAALGEGDGMYPIAYSRPPVSAMAAPVTATTKPVTAPAPVSSVPAAAGAGSSKVTAAPAAPIAKAPVKAAPAAGSKAPAAATPAAKTPGAPAAGNAAAHKAPAAAAPGAKAPAAAAAPAASKAADTKAPAAGNAAAGKAPVAAEPAIKTPAAPAAAPAADSKAPAATAPVTTAPAAAPVAGNTASKQPVAAAPATPTTPATPAADSKPPAAAAPAAGNQTASNAPVAADATSEPAKEPIAAVPAPSTPAADSTAPLAANSTAAAPVTQPPAAAPAAKVPAAPAAAANSTAAAPDSKPPAAAVGPAPAAEEPTTAAPATEQPATPATAPAPKEPAAPAAAPQEPAPETKPPVSTPAAAPATPKEPAPVTTPVNKTTPAPAATAPATKAPVAAPAPATTPAPATKAPVAAPTTPAPATNAPVATPAPAAAKAPAAGSSKAPAAAAPAKRNGTKTAAPTTPSKPATPAPSTGKTVKPPTATGKPTPAAPTTGKPLSRPAPAAPKPAAGKTNKTAARPASIDHTPVVVEQPVAVAPPPRRIVGRGGRAPVVARGNSMASWQQNNRMLFFMGPHCWDANAVPLLAPNREVLRPQPLFNFKSGGMLNVINGRELPPEVKKTHPGFEICMAVRHREFKWMGLTDKVYRVNGTHQESRQNEVPEPQASALRTIMRDAAEKWWQSVIMEPHSLEKPMFYLGLENGLVTNMLISGAHDRTAENIRLIPNGAAGFKVAGDRMCFKVQVMSPGTYDVIVFYASGVTATMKLSIGPYGNIQKGTANSITATLPAQTRMRGLNMGAMVDLAVSGAKPTEACLQLVSSTSPGKAIFSNLANIRFTKRQPWQTPLPAPRRANQPTSHHGFGASIDSVPTPSSLVASSSAAPTQALIAVPAPGLDMASPNNSWLLDVAAPAAGFGKVQDKWEALRMRNAWPDGQGGVFESMYSPYHTEDIAECSICKPEV